MCGICGFVSKQDIDLNTLKAMNDTMYHRGPDDSGECIYEMHGGSTGYRVGLGHRRLSIIDLSPKGHQPMLSCDTSVALVFNGEIYNFKEIKEELGDYPFVSDSDSEVILAAYMKWGIGCVSRFNGMFAICIYDRKKEEVYLVRDRIGKKPLYYQLEGGDLYFASELKPLMARPGFGRRIRSEVVSRFLFHQYINAPETVFEGVYKLEPGSILKYKDGNISLEKYWDINTVYHEMYANPVTDYREAKEELDRLLNKAVEARMIADVPLGTFLSGGYDSSLITAIAQKHSDEPVKTFSIGFNAEGYNEAVYAKEVASYLGTNHTEAYIDEDEMYKLVDSIPEYYDEPFADSSQIPTMLVSKLAREKVTVALSGDGGDEFYCGYNVYDLIAQAEKLDALGGMVHGLCNLPGLKQMGLEDRLPFKVKVIAANRCPDTKTQFGAGSYVSNAENMVKRKGLPCAYPIELKYGVDNWQIRRMLLDMDTYLPGDILCKVDRASMKYSLEARCPILDKDVMEYSFRIHHSIKYHDGEKKSILKSIAYDYIPRELLDRPKVGFGAPMDQWLRGPLKERLLDMTARDYLVSQDIFDPDFTGRFVADYLATGDGGRASGKNYSKMCWSLFIFQQWHDAYCR
ncbi:MAG: asparagine synthase (glutamine-hydrolyzing) [Lachnospiraceae bacterium]|nr:asparagine synthase (glutamine-hydrolyzing) [Lachnospiraceae bacterium]